MPISKVEEKLTISSITNLTALTIFLLSYLSPYFSIYLRSIGLYALSGALTNWLAIHMLFEKVPYIYGSGVIPLKFQEFKIGIKNIIMQQFFNSENIEQFFSDHFEKRNLNINFLIKHIQYDYIFSELKKSILETPLGQMITMFGQSEKIDELKLPVTEKLKLIIEDISKDPAIQAALLEYLHNKFSKNLQSDVLTIVDKRLNELTPDMVKSIIKDIIDAHLGWLVVWGGVFGGLIGLLVTLIFS